MEICVDTEIWIFMKYLLYLFNFHQQKKKSKLKTMFQFEQLPLLEKIYLFSSI